MAITIDQLQIETFEDNVRFLAQQKPSRLLDKVMAKQTSGSINKFTAVEGDQ